MIQSSNRHRRYLAAALAATSFTDPRGAAIVHAFHTWDQAIEECAELADVLYDRWSERPIVWGETHEQYDVLDRIAELWLQQLQRQGGQRWTLANIVDMALESSAAHAEHRAAVGAEQPRPRWFVVVGRLAHDDEDSTYFVLAKDDDQASAMVENELAVRRDDENDDRETYINSVIDCGLTQPIATTGAAETLITCPACDGDPLPDGPTVNTTTCGRCAGRGVVNTSDEAQQEPKS